MDLYARVREHFLNEIETHLGAQLSTAYLVHYHLPPLPGTHDHSRRARDSVEGAPPRRDETRLPRNHIHSVWRVTDTGREELRPEAAKFIELGAVQDDRYESAMFSLWVEPTEGVAYIDRVFGPLYGGLDKYHVRIEGDTIVVTHEKGILDY
jgi:hypothetical protein